MLSLASFIYKRLSLIYGVANFSKLQGELVKPRTPRTVCGQGRLLSLPRYRLPRLGELKQGTATVQSVIHVRFSGTRGHNLRQEYRCPGHLLVKHWSHPGKALNVWERVSYRVFC